MFRPLPWGAFGAVVLALCLASPNTLGLPESGSPSDAPEVYTDEDLKPKPRPPKPEAGASGPPQQAQSQPAGPSAQSPPAPAPAGPAAPPAQPAKPQTPAPLPSQKLPPQTRPGAQPASPPGAPQTRPAAAPPEKVAAEAPKTQPPVDPEAWTREWKRQKETREYWERRVEEAKRGVERLEEKIQYLERKRASIQNPFIPRVSLSEEDRKAEEGMDGAERLARVESQIATTKSELADARRAVEKAEQERGAALAPQPGSASAGSTN